MESRGGMIILMTSVLVWGAGSQGAELIPVKSPKCSARMQVYSVPRGAGLFFNRDCSAAFALPPTRGSLSVSGFTETTNSNFCPQVMEVSESSATLGKRMKELMAQILAPPQKDPPGGNSGGGMWGDDPLRDLKPKPEPGAPALNDQELDKSLARLRQLEDQLMASYERFSRLEGSAASVSFEWKFSEVVDAYQKKNPRLKILPIIYDEAQLSYAIKHGGNESLLTAVREVIVPGLSKEALSGKINSENAPNSPPADASTIFGGALTGKIQFTLAGSCPFWNPTQKKFPKKADPGQIAQHFSSNVQFSYSLQAFRKYHAQFNLSVLAKHIQEQKKGGGFFATETLNQIIERTDSKDWFELVAESDDSRLQYELVIQELKADLVDRVVRQIGYASFGGPIPSPGPIQPGENGASETSKGLRKCYHVYCQAAAVVIDVLNATFGSETRIAKFIRENNYWAEDVVSDHRMFSFFGSTIFLE